MESGYVYIILLYSISIVSESIRKSSQHSIFAEFQREQTEESDFSQARCQTGFTVGGETISSPSYN